MRSRVLCSAIAAAAIAIPTLVPQAAHAGTYPGNKCAADKLKAASSNCKAVIKAWSKFVGGGGTDTGTRDEALLKAANKMTAAWSKAEDKANAKGVDCVEMTATDSTMQGYITSGVGTLVTDIENGLTLSTKGDAKCGSALLSAAASQCAALLKNEAGFVQKLKGGREKRDAANGKAEGKFSTKVTDILASCATTATESGLDSTIDDMTDNVITNTIISPNVDDTQFTTISPDTNPGIPYEGTTLHPVCSHGDQYHFFVKRGSVNKLVMYYQGGGACWSPATCISLGTFDQSVDPSGSDNPNNTHTGFGDLTNPNNPFKDWNIVFVAYCTGDIHFGDSAPNYGSTIRHKGWHNSRTAEKWAREHFVAPDEMFVTGSSAGAYGAFFNAPLHVEVWPEARTSVLADAGNGIITPDFLNTPGYGFQQWNFQAHLPNIPGVLDSINNGTGIPAYTKAVADFYPDVWWAHYASSYDGGTGGQTGFYNVMKNPGNVAEWLNWWHKSCEWNSMMVTQAHATSTQIPSNYRYYIGTGSRHTMYGSDKVYNDNTSGTLIVDFVNQMLTRSPSWANVECPDAVTCGTTQPGDPLPTTRVCEGGTDNGDPCSVNSDCDSNVCGYEDPFSVSGGNVVVTCP